MYYRELSTLAYSNQVQGECVLILIGVVIWSFISFGRKFAALHEFSADEMELRKKLHCNKLIEMLGLAGVTYQ